MPREDPVDVRAALQAEVACLAAVIGASDDEVVWFASRGATGYRFELHPFIEIDDDGLLHWVVMERGQVAQDRTTNDPDELLYWSFESTAFSMAMKWELAHRNSVNDNDWRRRLFAKRAELLHTLRPGWARRWRGELASSLSIHDPEGVALLPTLPTDADCPGEAREDKG